MKEMQVQALQMPEMEACKTYKTCKLCAKASFMNKLFHSHNSQHGLLATQKPSSNNPTNSFP
jgi:hypothetical protein